MGINAGPMFLRPYSAQNAERLVGEAAGVGIRLMRADALWEAAEPAPPRDGHHRYDWSRDDLMVAIMARRGVRWWALVDYAPAWAALRPGVLHSPPRDPAEYAAFAAALARRYGPGGDFWRAHPDLPQLPVLSYEIWNEPDLQVFWPEPDPARYAALYAAARAAIHRVQPGARVWTGGLSFDTSFIPDAVRARPSLRRTIDGVAIHPYAPDPGAVLHKVAGHRARLRAAGLGGVPLAVTEVGWQDHLPLARHYATEDARAFYVSVLVPALLRSGCDVTAVLPYAWSTDQLKATEDDWYGLVAPTGGTTAGSRALARVAGDQQRPSRRSRCR